MSIWKRSLLYIKTHKFRSILLLFTLTVIASGMLIGLTVWQGSREGMQDLKETYGNSFKVTAIIPQTADDTRLWEQTGNVPGFIQYYYKGSKVDDELVRKIREVEGVTAYNKEYTLLLTYLPEIDLVDGLHTYFEKIDQAEGYPEEDLVKSWIVKSQNELKGCTDSSLLPYFRSNSLELIEGDPIREGDYRKILISDRVAEDNHLQVGDQIRVTELDEVKIMEMSSKEARKLEELPELVETFFTIAGIFHVNTSQYITELTPESDIADNFMFIDIDSVTEIYRENGAYYGEPLDPIYTATFFVDDPARTDEIIADVKQIPGVTWSDYELEVESSMYESALTPLENISRIMMFLLIFLLAVCILLLILVLRIWIGARKKEVGILISIGETRGRVRSQIFLEGGLLLLAALILAAGITFWGGNWIGNTLLDQMNRQQTKTLQVDPIENPATIEELEEMNEQFQLRSEAELVETLSCQLEASELLTGSVLLYLALGFAVWLETRRILRNRLKEILG